MNEGARGHFPGHIVLVQLRLTREQKRRVVQTCKYEYLFTRKKGR